MKTLITDYQPPKADAITFEQAGILCNSVGFGTASTDDFKFGEDISDIF